MTTVTKGWNAEDLENDVNMVSLWLVPDKTRWVAGIISGWIAAVIAMSVGGIFSVTHGLQFLFPWKLMGTILLGRTATDYTSTAGLIAGIFMTLLILGFWGFVYGQFVRWNTRWAFFGMGFTWGMFLWVFNWNLMLHSFKDISAANVPPGPALAVCLAYGWSMSIIGIIDPLFKGKR